MGIIPIPDTDVTNVGNEPGQGPLRAGGQPGPLPQSDADLPSTPNKAVKRQQSALALVRDLEAGPEQVRSQGMTYLPKAPGEDVANYSDRLLRSVFYNAYLHTARGLVGMIFRRDPVLNDDVPAEIVADWENLDLAGTHGDVFVRQCADDGMVAGHFAILVEYPQTGGLQSSAQDTGPQAPIRPYWVPIKKDQIVSWRTTVENGRQVLTQLVIREDTNEPVGTFGEGSVTRYRVFYRNDGGQVGFRLLRVTDDKRVIQEAEGTYPTQDEIPVAEGRTAGSKGLFDSDPPLIDLAYLNVAHYQMSSDYDTVIHKQVPVLVTIGLDPPRDITGEPSDTELVLGPSSGVNLPIGGDAKYIAADGSALGEMRQALADKKADMATIGLQQLAPEKRAAETAQAKRIDKAASDSALAVTARALQDTIERALGFHARYRKLDTGGSCTVNRDFDALAMDAQKISALSKMVADGQLTLETLWTMLVEGNVLPDDFDADAEAANLQAEAEIAAQEAADQAQQQLEAQMAMRQNTQNMPQNPARTPPDAEGAMVQAA